MFVTIPDFLNAEIALEQGDGGVYQTTSAVAEDRDTGRFVTLDCELAYVTHVFGQPSNRWFHEFSFQISCHDPVAGQSFSTQDRSIAASYIPEVARAEILPLVLSNLEALLARVRPAVVYRVSKTVNAPAKAHIKHTVITDFLLSKAYLMIETGTDSLGRTFWIMKK